MSETLDKEFEAVRVVLELRAVSGWAYPRAVDAFKKIEAQARGQERFIQDLVKNSGQSEWVQNLIKATLRGVCFNCGGDGYNMGYNGPEACAPCGATGKFTGVGL